MRPPFRGPLEGRKKAQDSTRHLLALTLTPGLTPRVIAQLALRAPLAEVVAHPDEHADLVPEDGVAGLRSGRAAARADLESAAARRMGIGLLAIDDPQYPALLRRICDPPPVLYFRGVLADDEATAVAVVGSRAATAAGRTLARSMASDLAAWGATVVSGLARGIDTAAHEGALDASGRTVAVLGCGLDRTYPPENERLAGRITSAGAVVSEFALGTPPLPEHFPRRNRVIAGWSRAVVVVEAAARSGALNTARCAADEGRDVLAVPGHPTQPGAAGTNQLIRDGAGLVRSAVDVAQELGIEPPAIARAPTDRLLRALAVDAPATLEELRDRSGLETGALLARLTELELRDVVRRLPGPLYVRTRQAR
jgi:DNA processing protein